MTRQVLLVIKIDDPQRQPITGKQESKQYTDVRKVTNKKDNTLDSENNIHRRKDS